jgi:hypothetical protein
MLIFSVSFQFYVWQPEGANNNSDRPIAAQAPNRLRRIADFVSKWVVVT